MADDDREHPDRALISLGQRLADLSLATDGWTIPDIVRSYGVDDESQEDYEDGYDHALERQPQLMTATYRKVSRGEWADSLEGSDPDPKEITLSRLTAAWTYFELARSYPATIKVGKSSGTKRGSSRNIATPRPSDDEVEGSSQPI
jgi:hypothetical protein